MPLETLLAIVTVFVAVAVGSGVVGWRVLGGASQGQRRLQEVTSLESQRGVAAGVAPDAKPLVDDLDARLARATRLFGKSAAEMGRARRRLAKAGYYGSWPAIVYRISELVLPVILAIGALYLFGWGQGLIFAGFGAIIGYLLPGVVVDILIRKRRKAIQNGLPDGLDLVIVCVEAGMGLDQAVFKTGEELALTHPALAEEFRTITTEIRAGKPRIEAFRNFADRTQLDDAKALVGMLVQTDRFGTSVAEALRVLADEMRTKRRQRAEERAQKLGVKLVFPLVFFLFPALYVVLLGPAIIRFARFFASR